MVVEKHVEVATRLHKKFGYPESVIAKRNEYDCTEQHASFKTTGDIRVDVINWLDHGAERDGSVSAKPRGSAISLKLDKSSITLRKRKENDITHHSLYFADPLHVTPHFAELIQECLKELNNLS